MKIALQRIEIWQIQKYLGGTYVGKCLHNFPLPWTQNRYFSGNVKMTHNKILAWKTFSMWVRKNHGTR